ncbi:LysR substrate binding domain protein [compost metagenome]
MEDWLASDSIDLGIVMNPAPERDPVMIGYDSWVAAVPTSHFLARRASLSTVALAELVDEPFVVATGGCHLHGQSLMEREGLALSDIRLTVRDWTTAFALIGEGLGVSLVPASTLPKDFRNMRVFALSPPIYRRFGLVCSASGRDSAPAQEFLKQVRKSALGVELPMVIEAVTVEAAQP